MGAILLLAGSGVLFYLATRPRPPAPSGPMSAELAPASAQEPAGPAVPPTAGPESRAAVEPQVAAQAPVAPESQAVAAAPAPVPGAPAAPAAQECQVSEVSIRRQTGSLVVLVRAGAEAKYRSFELTAPERIVVDLQGCRLDLPRDQYSQAVKHPRVQRVRISQFRLDPDIARVVLDVKPMPRYQIRSLPEGLEIRVLDGGP